MPMPPAIERPSTTVDRRMMTPMGRAILAGVEVRAGDLGSARGARVVVALLRVLTLVTLVMLAMEVTTGLSGPNPMSLHELVVSAAGPLSVVVVLFFGTAEVVSLLAKSHEDARVTRILIARMVHRLSAPVSADMPEERRRAG